MSNHRPTHPQVSEVARRNLVFVSGKGGVGKTLISQSIALALAREGKRTLWVAFEDPTRPAGEHIRMGEKLWYLNCDATQAFEEYATLKIGMSGLARVFLQNKLMRYLSKAAPGIHELVLLGKVWHERLNYEHVVVDMPSTGYGLAMFQSTRNFARLFRGGPINRDAEAMLETFSDRELCGQLIVALPEEMPLRESLELRNYLLELFPQNHPAFLVNRVFPHAPGARPEDPFLDHGMPGTWENPLAHDAREYAQKRAALEMHNLRLWRDEKLEYAEMPFVPPTPSISPVEALSRKVLAS